MKYDPCKDMGLAGDVRNAAQNGYPTKTTPEVKFKNKKREWRRNQNVPGAFGKVDPEKVYG